MKKILILETKEEDRNTIINLLDMMKEDIKIYATDKIEEAYHFLLYNNITLFIINVIIETGISGDVSGLYFAEAVRQIPQYCFTPIIFISNLEDPKLFSYKRLYCYAFMEKPFDSEDFLRLVRNALKVPGNVEKKRNLFLRIDGIIYSIRIDDIMYVEVERKRLSIYTQNEKIIVKNKTLSGIINEINSEDFIRCSRFGAVNKKYVKYIDYVNLYIKLCGRDEMIPIGSSMKKSIKKALK